MKNLFTSFLSSGTVQIANLVTGILAARLLLPEGRGELAFLLLWPPLIAELGSFSVNIAVSYFSARNEFSRKQIFAGATATIAVLSIVLMAVFILLMPTLFAGQRPELMNVGWIFVAYIPIHLFSACLFCQFQGAHAFTIYNVLRVVLAFGYIGFIFVCLWIFGTSPATFAYAFLAANVATLLTSVSLATRRGWISFAPEKDVIKSLLSYGSRFHVSIILAVVNRRLDIVFITILLTSADLGLYVAAGALQSLPMVVTMTMDILVFPKIAAETTEEARRAILGRYIRATLILIVPATAGMFVIAPYLVSWAFGEPFAGATAVVRILLLAGIPFTFNILITTYLRASDQMALVNKAELIGVIVSAATLFALVPLFGIVGAATAHVISALVPPIYFIARARLDVRALLRFSEDDIKLLRELTFHISRRKVE